ncbi:hypothetical protein FOCC_FOCC015386 [Frankliniella occidentalis]|nr:hypothetical protein FOCC_FOCC015386 [Frankliniella occidentalis]
MWDLFVVYYDSLANVLIKYVSAGIKLLYKVFVNTDHATSEHRINISKQPMMLPLYRAQLADPASVSVLRGDFRRRVGWEVNKKVSSYNTCPVHTCGSRAEGQAEKDALKDQRCMKEAHFSECECKGKVIRGFGNRKSSYSKSLASIDSEISEWTTNILSTLVAARSGWMSDQLPLLEEEASGHQPLDVARIAIGHANFTVAAGA